MSARQGALHGIFPIACVVVLGTIMSILDTTIVNIAIDHLAVDFHAPLATIQWVATGYLLALATVIPLTGWAADRFGTKRLYMTSLALFLAGSALSGMAWSAGSLIAFRVLQGLGGGMIMPAGMTILTQAAGPQRIGRVMSVVGVPMLMGPILGPVLGGWLVDDASWRWIFFVNLPIGAIALPLASRLLPRDEAQPTHRLDVRGLLLLSPGLAALVYGFAEIATHGGLASAKGTVPALAGVALVAAFVWHALRAEAPLIDVRLFHARTTGAAALTMVLLGATFFGEMILLPLYYQVARGQSALYAGLLMVPQGVGAAVMMSIAGRVVDRTGAGRIVVPGLATLALALAAFTRLGAHTSFWVTGAISLVVGIGVGSTMMPTMSSAYQTLARAQIARATTAFNIVMRSGGALGTALFSVVLATALAAGLPGVQTPAQGLAAAQRLAPATHPHVGAAVAGAFGHTFAWVLALAVLAIAPALLLPRGKAEPAAEQMRAAVEEPAPAGA